LRDGKKLHTHELYPMNEIPDELVVKMCGHFVYLFRTGRKDLTGEDWGDAFAYAIGGVHLDSPVGIADVVFEKMAWSMKTVKMPNPFSSESVRLISGRCSPDFSYGITDPHIDINRTGRAVLGIWNERVNLAYDEYNPVRTSVLVRSQDLTQFCLFEEESHRYRTSDYVWSVNENGNLVGKDVETGRICFTWQPHGSQFTIHTNVPKNAVRLTLKRPELMSREEILKSVGFDQSWVDIIRN